MTSRHRAREFRRFLDLIEQNVPDELAVHVVDSISTHRTAEFQRWLQRQSRVPSPFTPTCSSWIDLIERWFAERTTR